MMEKNERCPEKEYLGEILESVNHARDLVNQILTFSKQKQHEKKILNAARAINESMLLVQSFLPSTIKIVKDIDPDCGNILADPVQLNQAIVHLVNNAYHAMEKSGGTLSISLKLKNDSKQNKRRSSDVQNFACLMVKDTGVGMEPEILDKIFDPYFPTKKKRRGSGVGLSVVHGIVESHGGHIRVETETGKGTSVKVYLPESKIMCNPLQDSFHDVEIQEVSERILLVDDDKKVAIRHKQMLEKIGYKVTCFTSSRNAFQIFKSNPELFDLALLDHRMPELTGVELAIKIGSIRPEVPIVLCAGFAESLEDRQVESGSVRAVLNKPLKSTYLSYVLRKVLDSDESFISERSHHKLTG